MWPEDRPSTSLVIPPPMSAHAVRAGSCARRISFVVTPMDLIEWEAVQTKQGRVPLALYPYFRVRHLRSVFALFPKARPSSSTNNMDCLEPGAVNYFDYNTNTTKCSDGTFCPNPGNETCCFNHEGVGEITFHNNATIPTLAAGLSTYYEAAGYSIPTPTSSTSTSIAIASESIFISRTSTTTSAGSLGLRPSSTQPVPTATSGLTPALTTSTSLSSGGEAGIIIAGCVCAIVIGVLLYLLRRSRKKRLTQPGFETKVDGLQCEKAEMSGHDARTEMDAVEGCNLQDMRPIGRNELMGHEWSELRVEMPN